MSTLVTILHVIVSLFLMLTVLLQSGKGGGMGGAFGGSNAATVFGGSGASTFLRKLTAGAAIIFMSTSMILAYIASHDTSDALERFGNQQAKLAQQKEEAKEKALQEGSGSAGSASLMLPMGSDSGSAMTPLTPMEPPPTGSATEPATPAPGSAMTPELGSATTPATGSATKAPKAPATGSATKPAKTPATDSATKPAKTEATKPDTTKPQDQPVEPKPAESSPNAPKP
jgi:preprotein translocase subunit SecG